MSIQRNHVIHSFPSSVMIATFSHYENGVRLPANGQIKPMLSFFLPKVKSLLLIDQPHVVSDTIDPFIEKYENGLLYERYRISKYFYFLIYILCKMPSKKKTRMSYKIRDFFSVIFMSFQNNNTVDLFIGMEAVNAIAGLLLKKIGRVKSVVYYVNDYSPVRYGNTFFNSFYIWMDSFCVRHCDFTWDVSPAMQKARVKSGLEEKYNQKVIHVPNGLFSSQIKSLPIKKRRIGDIVYMGILEYDMGPDLAVKSMPFVLKKFPNAKLHMIGGKSEDILRIKKLISKLKLEKQVILYGFIEDNNEMAKIVRSSSIGIAPYRAFPDSIRWYGDAGKIRQYTAAGLPVVTTHVPPLGRYIVEKGAGIMVSDTIKSFSDGIITLLSDKSLYKKLSNAAVSISKNNTWENVYSATLRKMLDVSNSSNR